MEQVWISLGSNLGDRLANLHRALDSLRTFADIDAVSHAYETEPVDFTDQPWFVNAVTGLRMDTGQSEDAPQLLLARLLAIEHSLGRRRDSADSIPKGPRVIDMDILLFGNRVIRTPELTIPHPAMHLRRFVLEPLAEVAPDVSHPILHQSASQLLRALPGEGFIVRRMAVLDRTTNE